MFLIAIVLQILSGFYLGWYYIPELGLVVELREEMFIDIRFEAEVFYTHVRGVDTIFVLPYMHIFKKIYLKNYITAESDGWFLGGYAFFWFHYIITLGISLSATHLSDLTLTIIANIYLSIFNNTYKTYYIIFTNKHLNTDQITRLMVLHYFTPRYYLYLTQLHVLFCYESWDSDSGENVY
jgi:quinol-cytochrome oxidoreductase complex cytochrome b subunit